MSHVSLLSIQKQPFIPQEKYPFPLSLSSSLSLLLCLLFHIFAFYFLPFVPMGQINLLCAKNLVFGYHVLILILSVLSDVELDVTLMCSHTHTVLLNNTSFLPSHITAIRLHTLSSPIARTHTHYDTWTWWRKKDLKTYELLYSVMLAPFHSCSGDSLCRPIQRSDFPLHEILS